ncbi:hypothetical protein [Vibrio sinaloensis]|uniref:hypothetical protein n=1 Tax=Photobacterium sp. (strain ATCC 43367) TaxID=379097 RepID=UPI00057DA908|nr:hypothetical protein [Vibrio sinaloensis]KHT50287.1 hypothetical protein RJ46_05255 [Vibrio sinaloensis]
MKRSFFLLTACSLFSSYAFADSISLPIWKEQAQALGYELPKPIGFNLSYMGMQQGINVDSIGLNNLKVGRPLLDKLIDKYADIQMEAEPGKQVTNVVTLRADVWLFPFLNLYALAGKLDGYSETDVNVSVGIKNTEKPLLNTKINDFQLDLDGYTFGAGMVLAGGMDNWFSLVDASYTQTTLTVVDGTIDAIVVSPRIGYDFHNTGVPLRVWVGGMYQNVEQYLTGSIADLGGNFSGLQGQFEVKQHLTSPWNTLAGFQYQLSPNWYVLGEAGFGERQSVFLSLDRRF